MNLLIQTRRFQGTSPWLIKPACFRVTIGRVSVSPFLSSIFFSKQHTTSCPVKEKHSFRSLGGGVSAGSRTSFTPPLNSQFRFGLGLCLICRPRKKNFYPEPGQRRKKEGRVKFCLTRNAFQRWKRWFEREIIRLVTPRE